MASFGINEQTASAGAPVQPAVAGNASQAGGVKREATDKMKAYRKEGEFERGQMSEADKAKEGSARADIAFVTCLSSKSSISPKDGTPVPVGYRLQNVSNHPITVETMKFNVYPTERSKRAKNQFDVDTQNRGTKTVQPGQMFNVNPVEMAALISRLEYSGYFNGGDKGQVKLTAQLVGDESIPRPSLVFTDKNQKIRTIFEEITAKVGEGKGHWVCKDEYKEEFEALFIRATRPEGAGGKVDNAANTAAVFRKLLGV